jgi:hypothetical protein
MAYIVDNFDVVTKTDGIKQVSHPSKATMTIENKGTAF